MKSIFIFTLLLLIIMLESCNQAQKRPATETTANPSQTNNKNNMNTNISNNPLAAGLIRVGKEGIETGDDQVLDAYFAKDFVFHGPGGDLNLAQLKEVFSNYRNALTGFTITREQIIVEGNYVGARNTFTGTFDQELKQSPVGPIKPTGKPVKWEVVNTFRYNDEGLLAEEWVQTDNITFLKQFGVDILKTKTDQGNSSEN